MSFIEQNYLWFIVAGIIIVMIIVGYIAEKTDFGHKKSEKKVKPKEPQQKTEEKDLTNIKLSDVVYKDMLVPTDNSKSSDGNKELSKEELEALSVPIGETQTIETVPIDSDINDESSELSKEELEKLSVPIGETQTSLAIPIIEEINEPIVEPVEEINMEVKKESSVPIDQEQKDKNIWVDKPIEETKNDTENVASEEDIWKF